MGYLQESETFGEGFGAERAESATSGALADLIHHDNVLGYSL
jgi:hypothetical protein